MKSLDAQSLQNTRLKAKAVLLFEQAIILLQDDYFSRS